MKKRDINMFIDIYRKGKLNVEKIIKNSIKIEEIKEGFERIDDGKEIRKVVELNWWMVDNRWFLGLERVKE